MEKLIALNRQSIVARIVETSKDGKTNLQWSKVEQNPPSPLMWNKTSLRKEQVLFNYIVASIIERPGTSGKGQVSRFRSGLPSPTGVAET